MASSSLGIADHIGVWLQGYKDFDFRESHELHRLADLVGDGLHVLHGNASVEGVAPPCDRRQWASREGYDLYSEAALFILSDPGIYVVHRLRLLGFGPTTPMTR